MPPKLTFHANGKVLLSGEYLVMDGALALGLPLNLGQRMSVSEGSGSEIIWESIRPDGETWFTGKFDLFGFDPIKTSDKALAQTLKEIFEAAVRLNSDFLSKWRKYRVSTQLDFEPEWGLGSSSTLISCIAEWADIDSFDLMEHTFGGSGYDIACAKAKGPIFYQLDDEGYTYEYADFAPAFGDQLYLVYTGKKQNSRDQISYYRDQEVSSRQVDEISQITRSLCNVDDLKCFNELLNEHEQIIASILNQSPVKETHFQDFWGAVKSLGAWGGDFVLATSNRSSEETRAYFNQKGFEVFFRYEELAISQSTVSQANP